MLALALAQSGKSNSMFLSFHWYRRRGHQPTITIVKLTHVYVFIICVIVSLLFLLLAGSRRRTPPGKAAARGDFLVEVFLGCDMGFDMGFDMDEARRSVGRFL